MRKREKSSVSMTQQNMEKKTNIRNIVQNYKKTGIMPPAKQLFYGDFTEIPDIHEVHEKLEKVKEAFQSLPAKIRNQFRNKPMEWLKYMEDPSNLEEQYDLGLRERPEKMTNEPARVIVVNEEETEGNKARQPPQKGSRAGASKKESE